MPKGVNLRREPFKAENDRSDKSLISSLVSFRSICLNCHNSVISKSVRIHFQTRPIPAPGSAAIEYRLIDGWIDRQIQKDGQIEIDRWMDVYIDRMIDRQNDRQIE